MEKRLPEFKSLGDSALVVQWDNLVDRSINARVNALAKAVKRFSFKGLADIIPGYCSLTVLYDPVIIKEDIPANTTASAYVTRHLKSLLGEAGKMELPNSRLVEIPVCYDLSLDNDLRELVHFSKLPIQEVVDLHLRQTYYVYMPGFLPGFVYMGDVNEKIAIPRKQKPVKVRAGAVAIAGRQTGIYPVDTPGGWHVAGYTPLTMFDAHSESPCLLEPGDSVQFVQIDLDTFQELKAQQPV